MKDQWTKVSGTFHNWVSIIGFIIAVNCLILILALYVFVMFSSTKTDYLGVYIYLVLPTFLGMGVITIPIGMALKARRLRKASKVKLLLPVMDFNQRDHRVVLGKIVVMTLLFLAASALGTYQAVRFSGSVVFCGETCHQVMEPEYVTYLNSAHAKVACVSCHEGLGPEWFIKSKIALAQQTYAQLFHTFPRPIPTPLHFLRPEQTICENCHWPQKFYTTTLLNHISFLSDSANTEWDISVKLKVGPKNSGYRLKEGIHWHINPDFKIEYYSVDDKRESIPWVRSTNLKTGKVKIFMDSENPPDMKALSAHEMRKMDCMDCHNRPSHSFKPPQVYINNAMSSGLLPKNLPYLKKAAMEVLKVTYANKDEAYQAIASGMVRFYQKNQPELWARREPTIRKAIKNIQLEYSKNTFPFMKVDASTYPNHIGHLETEGCFRCHSGRHVSASGEKISMDCNLCHTITEQGPVGKLIYTTQSDTLPFIHPVPLQKSPRNAYCSDCHRRLYE